MEGSNDRLDRVEQILREMAARQQYHDEAFERFDARMKADEEAWRERMAQQDAQHKESWARHQEWLAEHNEHLAKQAAYLDILADQINASFQRVHNEINRVAALTAENTAQIDRLSEGWLYHNNRIIALEDRQAS